MPDDPRLKKLLDAMRGGMKPIPEPSPQISPNIQMRSTLPEEIASQPMAGGVRLPGISPIETLPSDRSVDFTPQLQQQKPIRIHLGTNRGLQGIDKSIGDLRTEQQAIKDYPSSEVRSGEILPPKMHHGLGDKLKSIGKGIVIGMGQRAATGDDSTAGLLGAGAAGGAVGGISPVSIDALQQQAQIDRDQRTVQNQLGIEGEQAQVEAAKVRPQIEAQRVLMESERQAETARRDAERNAETVRHNRETEDERRNRPRAERQPVTQEDEQGNKYLADPVTGEPLKDSKGNVRYAARAPREKPPSEDYASLRDWNYKKQSEAETNAQGIQAQLDALGTPKADDPNYWNVKDQRERLEKQLDGAKQDAQKYRDEGDKAAVKVRGQSSTSGKPDTRKGTISKEQQQRWLTDNPGKTIEDMKKLYPNARMAN